MSDRDVPVANVVVPCPAVSLTPRRVPCVMLMGHHGDHLFGVAQRLADPSPACPDCGTWRGHHRRSPAGVSDDEAYGLLERLVREYGYSEWEGECYLCHWAARGPDSSHREGCLIPLAIACLAAHRSAVTTEGAAK